MKYIPPALAAFLETPAAKSCYIADLFTIMLPSGQTIVATDFQLPIKYNGLSYSPTDFGYWKISRVASVLGVGSTCEVTLLAEDSVILSPFQVPLMQVLQLGLLDASTFLCQRFWMPTPRDISLGSIIVFGGQISEAKNTGRTSAKITVDGYSFKLNQPMPRNTIQPGCRWVLYGPGCTVNAASYTQTGAVAAGSSAINIVPATPFTQADGYFTQGVITFTSGQNTGLSMSVQTYASGQLRLTRSMLFPVAVGDLFKVVAGCDHTYSTCQLKFNNLINFGGEPYIPNYETAV